MSRVKRHDWEDAIIEAGAQGLIKPGAVNVCLRLAKAITWCPKGQKSGWPSGLYWKNGLALKSVGSSSSSWSDYRQSLFDAGFFIEDEGQNLIPQIPDLSEIRTTEEEATVRDSEGLSENRNEVSENRNEVSEIDYPYSVVSSVPSSVHTSSVVPSSADAPEGETLDTPEPEDVKESTSTRIPEFENDSIHEDSTASGGDTSSESGSSSDSKDSSTSTSSKDDHENQNTCESEETCESEKTCGPETTPEGRKNPENNLQSIQSLSDEAQGKTPANKKKGPLSSLELDRAAENFMAGCSNQAWRNLFYYGDNRVEIVLRAGKPEYYDLGSAEERIEAVMIAICGGKGETA